MTPSHEQLLIINTLLSGTNVVVNAVAGSGKTTTVLFLAQAAPGKSILQVTYNKRLQAEVVEKVRAAGITNLEVQTYHGLATRYYASSGVTIHDDVTLEKLLREDSRIKTVPSFDIIVIDEAQDMIMAYLQFVVKFMRDTRSKQTLCIMGDKDQTVFKFKAADSRFLTLAPEIWNIHAYLPLKCSYRLTNEIAWFVNNIMIGDVSHMNTVKSDAPVQYYIGNIFGQLPVIVCNEIRRLINLRIANPSDIFILAPSIRTNGPFVKPLENLLVAARIPVYCPTSDDQELNDRVLAGKVVFSSFHQAKGRERKYVFVCGFDSKYFELYARDFDPRKMAATLYVAATRASKQLYVLQHDQNTPLPFFKQSIHSAPATMLKICDFSNGKTKVSLTSLMTQFQSMSLAPSVSKPFRGAIVSDFVKHISATYQWYLSQLVNRLFKQTTPPRADAPHVISEIATPGGKFECVSDLTGIAIPSIHEFNTCRRSTIWTEVAEVTKGNTDILKQMVATFEFPPTDTSGWLLLANLFSAKKDGLHSRLAQIKQYDWLTTANVDYCLARIHDVISCQTVRKYEEPLNYTYIHSVHGPIEFMGRLDLVTDVAIWEFKCVSSITDEHKMQLAVYAWMWRQLNPSLTAPQFALLNIRTGELFTMVASCSNLLKEIVDILIVNRFDKLYDPTDEEFVRAAQFYTAQLISDAPFEVRDNESICVSADTDTGTLLKFVDDD